jgi:hypothetical protein
VLLVLIGQGRRGLLLEDSHLEAVHLDQLLEPVDDGDRAGGVEAAEVAGGSQSARGDGRRTASAVCSVLST